MPFSLKREKICCNFCDKKFERKGPDHSEFLPCPRCDSIARERVVYAALLSELNEDPAGPIRDSQKTKQLHVLEFSPRSGGKRTTMNEASFKSYTSSDFDQRAHAANVTIDLTDTKTIKDHESKYDVVVFAHVLEHIPNYQQALKNLPKLLSAKGFVILQVPLLEAKYTKITWDEFHGDNTRAYHRFGFDLEKELIKYFNEVRLYVCDKDPTFKSSEAKADKYSYLQSSIMKVVEFGEEASRQNGFGCAELCDAFILKGVKE